MPTIDQKIDIEVETGHTIAGTLITPGTLVPGVLFVHGWGGSQEQYQARAREVAALGCICLTFDLRGHALTRGEYQTVSRAINLRDVLAAYDLLAARPHVDRSAIAVVGSSYGGYLGAILTSMRPVRWLGLRAPALYLDKGWESPKLQLHKDDDLVAYRRKLVPAESNRALAACQSFEGDALLVESELDTIVPRTVLTSYRSALTHTRSITYRCIEGADHGLTQERDQRAYSQVLVGWLKEMIVGARAGAVVRAAPAEVGSAPVPPESAPHEVARGI